MPRCQQEAAVEQEAAIDRSARFAAVVALQASSLEWCRTVTGGAKPAAWALQLADLACCWACWACMAWSALVMVIA